MPVTNLYYRPEFKSMKQLIIEIMPQYCVKVPQRDSKVSRNVNKLNKNFEQVYTTGNAAVKV